MSEIPLYRNRWLDTQRIIVVNTPQVGNSQTLRYAIRRDTRISQGPSTITESRPMSARNFLRSPLARVYARPAPNVGIDHRGSWNHAPHPFPQQT